MRSALSLIAAGALLTGNALACPPAAVAELEQALAAAPLVTDPSPGSSAATPERRCSLDQASVVRAVLGRCQVRAHQSVLLLGAGRCLAQAGFRVEAARTYRAYLGLAPADRRVSAERARERRDRVRRWLAELGEPVPDTAALVLRSNLSGVVVRHLEGYPDGVVIGAGDTRILQPPGARRLSLSSRGFARVELPVDLVDGAETRAEVDWRRHITPRYGHLLRSWDDFARSGLTPAGYADRRQRPLGIALSVLIAGAGAALIGVCAANPGDACDSAWKQGLAYSAGGLLAGAGLVGVLSSAAAPSERQPQPMLPSTPAR